MAPSPFRTVLIANRGEIAVRIIRACRDAGLISVAVFADPDSDAPHVAMADFAVPLHGATAADTYLDIGRLLDAAARSSTDAVHPGYGFLAESAEFARAVIAAGLVWIGPRPDAIDELGDKIAARRVALRVGAPVVAGTIDPVTGAAEIAAFAGEHGLPIVIKSAFGGGGRGLRIVRAVADIQDAFEAATRESLRAFGRAECFVERYLDNARHVEVQILGDVHGHVVALGTRDCSVQRRHQKLVEEAPAPFLTEAQRLMLCEAAKAICREAGYTGAGTVEFLVDRDGAASFLEVNTRLQVEHTVTEETTGVDLVREQFRVAAGEALPYPEDLESRGHSIEFRINAEDPMLDFAPQPGVIRRMVTPSGPGVRLDSGVVAGSVVSDQFDSLMAKLVVTGATRDQAMQRARRALEEMQIAGLPTVLGFHRALVDDPAFTATDGVLGVHTRWIETEWDAESARARGDDNGEAPSSGRAQRFVLVGGRPIQVSVPSHLDLADGNAGRPNPPRQVNDAVVAPMQGTVIKITVVEGDRVSNGDLIAVVEAMKMENQVRAHKAGTITDLCTAVGSTLAQGAELCKIR
jgi:acetyl-CoA/propionyl-CoA carboxylase biotin carboxyl carrier protein